MLHTLNLCVSYHESSSPLGHRCASVCNKFSTLVCLKLDRWLSVSEFHLVMVKLSTQFPAIFFIVYLAYAVLDVLFILLYVPSLEKREGLIRQLTARRLKIVLQIWSSRKMNGKRVFMQWTEILEWRICCVLHCSCYVEKMCSRKFVKLQTYKFWCLLLRGGICIAGPEEVF